MLILSIIYLIFSNSLTLRKDKSILYNRVGIIICLYCTVLAITTLNFTSLADGIGLFGGLFHTSSITHISQIFVYIITAIILQMTSFYPRKVWTTEHSSLSNLFFANYKYNGRTRIQNKMSEQFRILEYPLILLFIITGASFLISSSDLVSVFISIELQSYGLYLLSTLYRNSELATNAGLTYFLLGGLSSCFILLGTSLLYANSGTTSLEAIYIITSLSDLANDTNSYIYSYKSNYINIGFLVLSTGFLFKVSAAPFHFWSPDVYDAIPTIVTTFVAIVAKISIFIFLLEIVHYTSNSLFNFQLSWTYGLITSSLLSLIIGAVLGLSQSRIKRLFAYSTISHVGFILLALSINSIESIQAFIFYIIQYSISNLNAFIILISVGYSLYFYTNEDKANSNLLDKNHSPIQLISQMRGYFYINPILALSLTITIFSFAGIPPLMGFFAKQIVLSAALDEGYFFMAIVAILTSVISAVYYLNIIKEMYFNESIYENNKELGANLHGSIEYNKNSSLGTLTVEKYLFKFNNIILSSTLTVTISILTLIILLFMLLPDEMLSMVNILSIMLFNS